MEQKRLKPKHLKVIEGKGKPHQHSYQSVRRPIYFLLIFLSLFLIGQILFGWIWNNINQKSINLVLAGEGSVEVSFPATGIITFSEKVILAPRAGFVYYKVREGEKVPVGKELAAIADFPLNFSLEEEKEENEETGLAEYFQHLKSWFFGETNETEAKKDNLTVFYFSSDGSGEVKVVSPLPGLVSFKIDGLEKYGPDTAFPYFTPEEISEKMPNAQILTSGERVLRSTPLLKLINNFYWYFSAVLPPEYGRLVAEKDQDKLIFSFEGDKAVQGRKIESRERDDGSLEITWCIDREVPGLYKQRWATAEIVYKNLKGVFIPKSALAEIEGKKGVYVLEKGLIVFREITVLAEGEDSFLVNNVELYERVVEDAARVTAGQSFYR